MIKKKTDTVTKGETKKGRERRDDKKSERGAVKMIIKIVRRGKDRF